MVEMEMTSDVAISFAHSQYDKLIHSTLVGCRILVLEPVCDTNMTSGCCCFITRLNA